ncbi:MAG: triose-phosphate isomerase [Candidatus Levybacteria bacterium CG_4_9_14_3_um_filter_35_16]|nr:MAG: triose-phosphate isomerase [Candidatus Levybacteria bacterium CG22_combo_CG10-13_8_21_14_all_35_11]PIY94451.1 MAG: triose-phosphate isomerase [Candidatus Levybacteria bacterium CG_4_10_14_0_8_um_filter_35_23]PIZ98236.1 MAG: triose-phosphate isomerase [Candidatus Levybacteria bacterium CG_4_10_14_0_2_um_filter_35_8]PJA91534.1 MAG: triose-phosphate isomerase [Candidatus Levybacteria bacterium CG_4_9_14_3_um_filter_35_16]PJC54560.1 MAG: triose-phosphate isomerase [Candidatus Levybacteria b
MNPSLIIANWKSNKTLSEVEDWLEKFSPNYNSINKTIIICPSFTLLSEVKSYLENKKLKIELGGQNISQFENGEYTGEVNAAQIKDFANYVLVGHSERRKNFEETNQILDQKINLVKKYGLIPIFCIQGKDTYIPKGVGIVAYEPIFAIGTGNSDTPKNANEVGLAIKRKGYEKFLYGGSINSQNVASFTSMPSIDGVLVGRASLDPVEFGKIIKLA